MCLKWNGIKLEMEWNGNGMEMENSTCETLTGKYHVFSYNLLKWDNQGY